MYVCVYMCMYTYMLQAVMSRYTSWLWIHNQTHTYVDVRACVRIIYMKPPSALHIYARACQCAHFDT